MVAHVMTDDVQYAVFQMVKYLRHDEEKDYHADYEGCEHCDWSREHDISHFIKQVVDWFETVRPEGFVTDITFEALRDRLPGL